jgi:hypothetical protein
MIPRRCVLCDSRPIQGAWRVRPSAGWNVARMLLLCGECADSTAERGTYPFVAAADLPAVVWANVCWCEREPAIVPWCPKHGERPEDLKILRECPWCDGKGQYDVSPPDGPGQRYVKCSWCDGTGRK